MPLVYGLVNRMDFVTFQGLILTEPEIPQCNFNGRGESG